MWLISQLKDLKEATPRTIIFCRSHAQCTSLYAIFEEALGRSCKLFAMYHGSTDSDIQREVVEDFEQADGKIRILFATIAFGMGVNVQAVHSIIHVGTSLAIDDYMQESGRCGRDGAQSVAVILAFPGMYSGTRTEDTMKEYVSNTQQCRRKLLLEAFSAVCPQIDAVDMHKCCDICAKLCECHAESCPISNKDEMDIVAHFKSLEGDAKHATLEREVTPDQRELLMASLLEYRLSLLDTTQVRYLAGSDIASGVPLAFLDDIVRECHFVFTFEEFRKRYPFYDLEHASKIWDILQSAVSSCPLVQQQTAIGIMHEAGLESSGDELSDGNGQETEDDQESDEEYERRLISSSSDDGSEL